MTKFIICLGIVLLNSTVTIAQEKGLKIKQKKFKTTDKSISIQGEVGYLTVPENRSNQNSRMIEIKFIRLKSLSDHPKEPIIYLEGGGSACTWQAESPTYLADWLPILEVADLIFVDQRGTTDKELIHIQKNEFPADFFVLEEEATSYYQGFATEALKKFEDREIDVTGYTLMEHAIDIKELTEALQIDNYSIFGFSFGTSIGMTLMGLDEGKISNAVLVSADGPSQSFNYPSYLDDHFSKIADLARQDEHINQEIPDLNELLLRVMDKLEKEPAVVSVKHPISKKTMDVKVGSFGLALILRLDIDDNNDIPVIPRLLYSIDQGDNSILQWFVQKRVVFALGLPGNGINQALASGVSVERRDRIKEEAEASMFGNVVNFPFSAAMDVWPTSEPTYSASLPLNSNTRTLFITGDLDCRTPVEQVSELQGQYPNSTHLIVKNAGHEKALWNVRIFDEAIPEFFRGKDISEMEVTIKPLKFIPLIGPSDDHPALKK